MSYYLHCGEGEQGNWFIVETTDINRVLKEERCDGDRWAHAYKIHHKVAGGFCALNVETGEQKYLPSKVVANAETRDQS